MAVSDPVVAVRRAPSSPCPTAAPPSQTGRIGAMLTATSPCSMALASCWVRLTLMRLL